MALAIGTPASITTLSSGSSLSVNVTCSGSDTLLIAYVLSTLGGNRGRTVTYNGVSMTRLAGSYPFFQLDVYYLINPASGTNSLSIPTLTTGDEVFLVGIPFSGADQSTQPDAHSETVITGGNAPTANVTVVTANSIVLAAYENNAAITGNGSGQTTLVDLSPDLRFRVTSKSGVGAGSDTESFTGNAGVDSPLFLTAIRPKASSIPNKIVMVSQAVTRAATY